MKLLFTILLVLGAVIGFTMLAQQDPGYVLISYSGWSVETSLTLTLLALLVAFILLTLVLRLLTLPRRLALIGRHRRTHRARKLTNQGLIALAEGNWAQAEKKLGQGAANSDTPLINYLGAARAAQKLGAQQLRDDFLSQAFQSMPDAELAVGLTQADLQLSQGQTEQALATLNHLRSIAPKHAYVLYLLKKLYEKLQSWDDLLALLPELEKHKVLSDEDYAALELQVHMQRLATCSNLEELEQHWQQVPKKLRHTAELLLNYAAALNHFGAEEQAETTLREFLKKTWDPQIVSLYGQLRGGDLNQQLAVAEHWLEENEHHPELLLALGRLCLYNQLWGKARSYLEASLGMEPRAETYCELGNLLQQLGEKEQAAEYFRQGLQLNSGNKCTLFSVPKQRESAAAAVEPPASYAEEEEVDENEPLIQDTPPPATEKKEQE